MTLEEENDELRERIRQLEVLLGMNERFPGLELTPSQSRVLGHLFKREMATKDSLMAALYSDRPGLSPDPNVIAVFICKLRANLKPMGVEIDTVWGRGWKMSVASKKVLTEFVAKGWKDEEAHVAAS